MATPSPVSDTKTKPVQVFRDRGVSVSVFPHQVTVRDQERTFHSVSIQRSYKDGGSFKSTHSLGKDDLPVAQLLMAQAWQWIVNAEASLRKKAAA